MSSSNSQDLAARLLIVCTAIGASLGLVVVPAAAQVEPPPHPLGEYPRYQWQLTPAAEPQLALRFDFRVPTDRIVPANAAEVYMRAVVRAKSVDPAARQLFNDRYDVWVDSPLDELPRDEIRGWLEDHEQVLIEIERATHCRDCDWELSVREFGEFWKLAHAQLDEFQEIRHLSRILWIKSRLEIAEGDYDQALQTIGMNIRLGRDTARAPLLICSLIGAACIGIGAESLEELIQTVDSPNTYWAIATVPNPPIDIGRAIENEVGLVTNGFEYLRDPETATRTPEQWTEVMGRDFQKLMVASRPEHTLPEAQSRAMAAGFIARGYPMAKRELIAAGMDPEELEAMPNAQVVAIHQSRLYQNVFHEIRKWALLPDHLSWQFTSSTEERLAELGVLGAGEESREIFPTVRMLLPAIDAASVVPIRLKRKFALLQNIEAIRAYMAVHDGRFPASLDDLAPLPAVYDPLTGKPFQYTRTDAGATIVVEVPDRYAIEGMGGIYELSVGEGGEE